MAKYVFDNPEAMLDWINRTAAKLLTIRRQDFGKISVELVKTQAGVNYEWVINPKEKIAWERELLNEKR